MLERRERHIERASDGVSQAFLEGFHQGLQAQPLSITEILGKQTIERQRMLKCVLLLAQEAEDIERSQR